MLWTRKLSKNALLRLHKRLQKRLHSNQAAPTGEQQQQSCLCDEERIAAALHSLLMRDESVPVHAGGENIYTGNEQFLRMPHYHAHRIAKYYYCNFDHITKSICMAMDVRDEWSCMPAEERAAIWRRAADILDGDLSYKMRAAIMLGQAKTLSQAQEDTRQLVEELRQNADLLESFSGKAQKDKPADSPSTSVNLRPLDGFVASIGPSNMASMSVSLALCPALMGNCVLWKPSARCVLPSYLVKCAMVEAGLPFGVVSFLPANPKMFLSGVTRSPHLAGISYGGDIKHLHRIVKKLSSRLDTYPKMPRILAECGGKNFHFIHPTAAVEEAVEATVRATFDYAGQLYNGCSRLYVPQSLWQDFSSLLLHAVGGLRVSDPDDFAADLSAVSNERIFDRTVAYMLSGAGRCSVEVLCGGDFCKMTGYFVEPTVLRCKDPEDVLMRDLFFGPVLSLHVYEDKDMNAILARLANGEVRTYSGAIFAQGDDVIAATLKALRMSSSNLYVNGPCTGGRPGSLTPLASHVQAGVDPTAGSPHHLLQWTSSQVVAKGGKAPKTTTTTQKKKK